jgi:hypothetical protein
MLRSFGYPTPIPQEHLLSEKQDVRENSKGKPHKKSYSPDPSTPHPTSTLFGVCLRAERPLGQGALRVSANRVGAGVVCE